jgi:hypothetical protein
MIPSLSYESTKNLLSDDTPIAFYPKRQWDMMPSLPCESTQKLLSDDTHIVLLPKKAMGHKSMMPSLPSLPCESTQNLLSNDNHIIYYQKRHGHNMYNHLYLIPEMAMSLCVGKWTRKTYNMAMDRADQVSKFY